ncbi:MAG TPA: hypothetical protein VKA15_04395 [Isosphaeraceae bacterium]|nr:hypothetical protein [Isosphaeraceae bacterium]
MAPTVAILHELSTAIIQAPGKHGLLPAATSRATAELAAETTYSRSPDWDRPLADVQSLGGIVLLAAADYGRSFAVLFEGTHAPVYGHLAVARAALEACVVAAWLNEPAIEVPERIKRGLRELVYSAHEEIRLNIDRAAAKHRKSKWKEVAQSFGWAVTEKDRLPVVDGVGRPSVPDGINKLLVDSAAANIGRAQWSYLSGVLHVTWYALRQAVETPVESPVGPPLAAVGTDSRSVYAQAVCVIRALRVAANRRMTFMGWADPEWPELCKRVEAHEGVLIRFGVLGG